MHSLPTAGESADGVLSRLNELKKSDGVVEVAYLWKNALDPTAYPSLGRFERDVTAIAASHLRGDAVGSFTSGGTESLMLAVKTMRDWARAEKGISRPNFVMPVTAHPAFMKASHYLDVEVRRVPVDQNLRADVPAIEAAIDDSTAMLVGSSPGYSFGVIDPIPEIAALAASRGLLCHVDACIGGWLLPLFRELGADVPPFDFEVDGVTSISVDFHKYALCAKGASCLLFRDPALRRYQFFSFVGWPGYVLLNSTIQSTKSGGPLASAWAVLHHIGHDGYLEIARHIYDATQAIVEEVHGIDGARVVAEPDASLIAVATDVDAFAVSDAMGRRGWRHFPQLSYEDLPRSIHLTVLPGNVERVGEWAAALRESIDEVAAAPEPTGLAAVKSAVKSMDLDSLSFDQLDQLLDMAGIDPLADSDGPSMAEMNDLLDSLPPAVCAKVLTLFLDRMTRPSQS
ncbi:MAG: aspartate aminotransferase family protein [Acidobacteria bacterium]|nr:MAG: aspartate aminotransferase family protein [Acidobacteriota bacterium]